MDILPDLADRLDREPVAQRIAPDDLRALGHALRRATRAPASALLVADGAPVGRIRPFGSVTLYRPEPGQPLRHRLLEVGPTGAVEAAIDRGPTGVLRAAWVVGTAGDLVGLLPGGPEHPLWGPSDRIVRAGAAASAPLTVAGAVDWGAIDRIPPLAEPAQLPPGTGGALLNLVAGLLADQGRLAVRYRGPFPTEQLFWSLVESFIPDPAPDPAGRFLAEAEDTFLRGLPQESAVGWRPAPHERLRHDAGLTVQVRDGVEKVVWNGRAYHRVEAPGIPRREHRVVRRVDGLGGAPRFVASIAALGVVIEDHVVLDERGETLERRAPAPDDAPDRPMGAVWRDALGALLPLESTSLLAGAIDAVWPAVTLAWGGVPGDLVEARGLALRLSPKLADAYRRRRAAHAPGAERTLAHCLVRETLGLIGPAVRGAAAGWLEALPAPRQAERLAEAAARDRVAAATRALAPLARLLDGIASGEALPR